MKETGLPLNVLAAKGENLKAALEAFEDKNKYPSALLSESLNQLSAATAEALPAVANLLPARIPPDTNNDAYSSETVATLLGLTKEIIGMIEAH
jgi:hypothetical protein